MVVCMVFLSIVIGRMLWSVLIECNELVRTDCCSIAVYASDQLFCRICVSCVLDIRSTEYAHLVGCGG